MFDNGDDYASGNQHIDAQLDGSRWWYAGPSLQRERHYPVLAARIALVFVTILVGNAIDHA
jgi:hypothetical protein